MIGKIIRHILSPHCLLVGACIAYMALGALVFQALEGHNLKAMKAAQMQNIDHSVEKYIDQLWHLSQTDEYRQIEKKLLVDAVREDGKQLFDEYLDTVFAAHRMFRHGYDDDAPSWDFITSFFFTATMLTSIGYGFVAPSTFNGRLFGIIYCIIGIPLTLVTVANIAKFVSESAFLIHYKLWKVWMAFKNRFSHSFEELRPHYDESEDEQELLDRIRLVRFSPIIVFLLVFIYGLFGSYIVKRNERWSYAECMYFVFISILTVGFGDYRPKQQNMITVLVVIMGGIILTTMCMDVVGRMYLKEIHYIGRKIKSTNPFFMIRQAKAKRRRRLTASLLLQIAQGIAFAHQQPAELQSRRDSKKPKHRKRGSSLLRDGDFMFARLPPDPPRECQVISTSAYSARLAWAPAFSADDQVTYNIRYRIKHNEQSKVRELKGIQGNTAEIMSIDSCSLYEFRITAVSRFGQSRPVYLVQYTEPQLSPQHILAKRLNSNTIELTWEPPYKRTNNVKNYIVYYTDNPNAHFSEWEQTPIYGCCAVFPDLRRWPIKNHRDYGFDSPLS